MSTVVPKTWTICTTSSLGTKSYSPEADKLEVVRPPGFTPLGEGARCIALHSHCHYGARARKDITHHRMATKGLSTAAAGARHERLTRRVHSLCELAPKNAKLFCAFPSDSMDLEVHARARMQSTCIPVPIDCLSASPVPCAPCSTSAAISIASNSNIPR
ncbi:hypothetical protein BU16DRAFT_141890 [Lophium mytilinum]|uniref:Uncharacterized protein n=1 Tax=Lophium mytilinum TaxID=390894 RepID=A0A6A6QGA2_9PEZI|nr:hypothetical protein BU16DRAFT_141890 [Lophium mytilinum]